MVLGWVGADFTVMTQLPLIRWDLFTVRSMCRGGHFFDEAKRPVCGTLDLTTAWSVLGFRLVLQNRIGIWNKRIIQGLIGQEDAS